MSSSEARATRWLRYTNSSIVQEDYKPSSSKTQSEESPGDGVKLYDTKWWLHQQPKDNPSSFWEPSWVTLELEQEYAKIKEFEAVIGNTLQKKGIEDDDEEKLVEFNSELTKAELLEALCHSQTRAREAEKAAQQANNEKEDMITHFLKQASQLFAYKQWLHILQLEAIRDGKYQPMYTRFPGFVPKQKRVRKRKHDSSRGEKGKSFWSFLLGLALGGGGLLLGWTLGWLFR